MRKSYSPLQVTTVRTRASSCNVPRILSEATVWIGWSAAGCGFQWLRGETITAVIAASRRQLLTNLARKKRTKSLRVWEVTLSRRFCTGRRSSVSYWDWSIRWLAPRFGSYVRRAQRSQRPKETSHLPLHAHHTHALTHARAILLSLPVGCSCWVGQTKDLKIISPDKSTISQTLTPFAKRKVVYCLVVPREVLKHWNDLILLCVRHVLHRGIQKLHMSNRWHSGYQVPSAHRCKPKSDTEIFTLFCWFWLACLCGVYNIICFLLTFRPPPPHTHTLIIINALFDCQICFYLHDGFRLL